MQYNVENSNIAVTLTTAQIDVVVGDAARIDVGAAVNYIKSGQAEIQEVVDSGTAAFNLNASQKTIAFNNNASNKTTDFNNNASDKTTAFNNNATAKTGDFNDNATNKTNAFNQNATDKTDAFNLNATNKTTDFNDNYTAKKALIDAEVATASGYAATAKQWAIGDPSEPVGNSAKYWADTAAATLANKQDKLTVGAGIDITSDVISNAGVRSVATGASNGTISVNTNGTSAEVSVYGLGSAAYTASTDYATSAQGALADTAVQPADLANYVTTNTAQDVTGVKTFIGEKRIKFKQSASGNTLGFTLYDNNNKEAAAFEYRPNTINSYPLMYLGQYKGSGTSYISTPIYVGFRCYDNAYNASYNLVAPLAKDAKTPFSLDTNYKTLYLPLGITDGNTTVVADSTGVANISTLLPTIPTVDQTYDASSSNAQSGVAVASAISGKADDNDVVHLAGTETITGKKTFTDELQINGNDGYILFHLPGVQYTKLKETANGLEVQEGGSSNLAKLYAGASDANNSVLTTVAHAFKLLTDGVSYVKLGNGLIIQWGYVAGATGVTTHSVTFATPFATVGSYICVPVVRGFSSTVYTTNYSTTGVDIVTSSAGGIGWIAIGY